MKLTGMIFVALVVGGLAVAVGANDTGKVQLKIALPRPQFTGTPRPIRSPNLEPSRNGKSYAPIEVPAGGDKVLSKGCKVTSSDSQPVIGALSLITDGDKEHDAETYVELGPGK